MTYIIQLCSVVVVLWSMIIPTSFAAKLAPGSTPGSLPYQAPLQPMPHGVGANISNNIQHADALGPPDSARTVAPAEPAATESDIAKTTSSEQLAERPPRPGQTRRVIVWILICIIVAVVAVWAWLSAHRQTSKDSL